MKIDLHIHSKQSDGSDTIAELVPKIAEAGVDVFALTDHDRTSGWVEASELANQNGLSFIPGIEITAEGRVPNKDGDVHPFGIHLLAYLPDSNDQALAEMLEKNVNHRYYRAKKFAENLQSKYPEISFELVLDIAEDGSTLGRPDLAAALVKLGYFESVGHVFEAKDSPISKHSPFYVRNEAPDVLEVIRIVRKAGGVPVIAHPLARTSREDSQPVTFPQHHFEAMVDAGLLGIETDHLEVPVETRAVLEKFANEFGLVTTGSSDYHGLKVKANNPLGLRTTSVEMLKKIILLGTGTKPTLNHEF